MNYINGSGSLLHRLVRSTMVNPPSRSDCCEKAFWLAVINCASGIAGTTILIKILPCEALPTDVLLPSSVLISNFVFRYGGGASKTFGSVQENVETWRCVHTLRGHSGGMFASSSHFVSMRLRLIICALQ